MGVELGVEWFYIYVGASVLLAAGINTLLRFDEWKYRVTTKDKLSFSKLMLGRIISDNGSAIGIKLGFQLKNAASFPIEYSIQSIQTQIGGEYAPNRPLEKDTYEISAFENGWFYNHAISLETIQPPARAVEGSLNAIITYGRPRNQNREMEIKKKIFVKFNSQGDVENIEWYDA